MSEVAGGMQLQIVMTSVLAGESGRNMIMKRTLQHTADQHTMPAGKAAPQVSTEYREVESAQSHA